MNYYRMSEKECELLGRIFEDVPLITDYELHGEFIPVESFISIIEDLYGEVDFWKEKYEDLQNDLESNYRPLSIKEQVE